MILIIISVLQIHNTFEMVVDDMVIDSDYLVDRVERVRQLYKGLDVIGWYTNGKSLTEENKTFHFQVFQWSTF